VPEIYGIRRRRIGRDFGGYKLPAKLMATEPAEALSVVGGGLAITESPMIVGNKVRAERVFGPRHHIPPARQAGRPLGTAANRGPTP
jgi:hypothetical protein